MELSRYIHVVSSICLILIWVLILFMKKGNRIHKAFGYSYLVFMFISVLTSFIALYFRIDGLRGEDLIFKQSKILFFGILCLYLTISAIKTGGGYLRFFRSILLLVNGYFLYLTFSNANSLSQYTLISFMVCWCLFLGADYFRSDKLFKYQDSRHKFYMIASGMISIWVIFVGASRQYFPEPIYGFLYSVVGAYIMTILFHIAIILLYLSVARKVVR